MKKYEELRYYSNENTERILTLEEKKKIWDTLNELIDITFPIYKYGLSVEKETYLRAQQKNREIVKNDFFSKKDASLMYFLNVLVGKWKIDLSTSLIEILMTTTIKNRGN